MVQNNSEWPILNDSQFFQSFSTEMAQNDVEHPILSNSQLFQSFRTKVAQNDSELLISTNSQLFQSFPIKVAQNDSEWPILPNLQLFQSFSTKVAQIMRQCTWPPPPWNGTVEIQIFRFQLGLGPVLGWWSSHPSSLGYLWWKLLLYSLM